MHAYLARFTQKRGCVPSNYKITRFTDKKDKCNFLASRKSQFAALDQKTLTCYNLPSK